MKRFLTLGLRLLGVALVAFILWRIQYRDEYRPEEGIRRSGTVIETQTGARFEWKDDSAEIRSVELPPDWERGDEVKLGLFSIVSRSDKLLLILCLFVYGPITLWSITRWWFLLRTVKIPIPYRTAFRLTFIGFFFNSAVPGLTGGDVIKAFYIARETTGARVRAVMSVLVDRVIGLFALGLLSGIALLPRLGDAKFQRAGVIVAIFLLTAICFGAVFLSRRLRRLVRLESLIGRLPLSHVWAEVDRGIVIYRSYPKAVGAAILLSLLNHVSLVLMAIGFGTALGIRLPAIEYCILVPVCMMMASIPVLPGGWGIREGAFLLFFTPLGVPETLAVALSIILGLTQLAWSLLGGAFFLLSPDRASSKDLQAFHSRVDEEIVTVSESKA